MVQALEEKSKKCFQCEAEIPLSRDICDECIERALNVDKVEKEEE